jgi:hypothetical protein
VISEMSEELHTTFNDFDSLKPKLQLFSNPKDIEVTQQTFDLQMKCRILFFNKKKRISGRFLENAIPREVPQASKFIP